MIWGYLNLWKPPFRFVGITGIAHCHAWYPKGSPDTNDKIMILPSPLQKLGACGIGSNISMLAKKAGMSYTLIQLFLFCNPSILPLFQFSPVLSCLKSPQAPQKVMPGISWIIIFIPSESTERERAFSKMRSTLAKSARFRQPEISRSQPGAMRVSMGAPNNGWFLLGKIPLQCMMIYGFRGFYFI